MDLKEFHEDPEVIIPRMVVTVICQARDAAKDKADYQLYEQALDLICKVGPLKRQRERALADIARLAQELDA